MTLDILSSDKFCLIHSRGTSRLNFSPRYQQNPPLLLRRPVPHFEPRTHHVIDGHCQVRRGMNAAQFVWHLVGLATQRFRHHPIVGAEPYYR